VDERERVSEAKLFRNLLWMDKKKRRIEEREESKILVLRLCATYQLLVFHNLRKF